MTMTVTLLFVLIGFPLLIAAFISSYELIERVVKEIKSDRKRTKRELHITG